MRMFLLAAALGIAVISTAAVQTPDPHGWISTETVKTRFGDFEFRNGYPDDAAAAKLRDVLLISRAVEAYLTQMPAVSWYRTWKGTAAAGDKVGAQSIGHLGNPHGCQDAAADRQYRNGLWAL